MDDSVPQVNESIWEGFTKPDMEFLKVCHDDLVNMLPLIDSLAELKVILYVMRHTWGFQEYDTYKRITVDEFINGRMLRTRERMDGGTGLSDFGVKTGINRAIEHGFLECEIDYRDLGRISKSYRLKTRDVDPTTDEEKTKQPAREGSRERLKQLQTMPYEEYLQSPEWVKKRKKALRFAQYKCQLCNSSEHLNVHHRTYERRGHELMNDLTVLCSDCHSTFSYNRELAQ